MLACPCPPIQLHKPETLISDKRNRLKPIDVPCRPAPVLHIVLQLLTVPATSAISRATAKRISTHNNYRDSHKPQKLLTLLVVFLCDLDCPPGKPVYVLSCARFLGFLSLCFSFLSPFKSFRKLRPMSITHPVPSVMTKQCYSPLLPSILGVGRRIRTQA